MFGLFSRATAGDLLLMDINENSEATGSDDVKRLDVEKSHDSSGQVRT